MYNNVCHLVCYLPPLFHLDMHRGCTAEDSLKCTYARETSFCYCQPRFLFIFGVVYLKCWRSQFGNFNQKIQTSDLDENAALLCRFKPGCISIHYLIHR